MKQISQLFKEMIPVIIGILIALVINNWNEDRKDKKYLNQILSTINAELDESRMDIKRTIPKQQVLIDTIQKYINVETISLFDIIRKADGIQRPTIKNNSWKAIANSKIELIEFEKLSALSEIDETKEILNLKTEKLIDFMIENLKTTNQEKKEIFMLLCQEILTTTRNSHFEINEFLK